MVRELASIVCLYVLSVYASMHFYLALCLYCLSMHSLYMYSLYLYT
ncbi:hypothetical protein CPTAbTP3Phi1_001 [Acinetobacter phage AbTP3phi1]|uniref:Uncharacterized protein n=1 Tax=Acinetobacter phage AbTP3phi1 TaxID=2920932 RepID=A0AC61TT96_9CAUD|nr:hypothetical protein CPTAbTP3Phi1_001 [Acinetobacter phage AbTP3phi1]